MEQETYDFLLKEAAKSYKSSAMDYGAGGFAQIAGGLINYGALKTEASQYKMQAQNIELQALERANQLRQELLTAFGNYEYSAAARGISVGSGSVRDNLRSSAENFGKDMQSLERTTKSQAGALKAQAKISKIRATAGLVSGIADGGLMFGKSYQNYGIAERLKNNG